MRKLFNEFFYIPRHGKVREKVMLARLASMITVVIFCLVAMSITAYAYFSYNVTSGSCILKSASFKTEVQVQILDSNGKAVDSNITPVTSDYKSFKIEGLTVGETYTITITPIKDQKSAKTGFVIVKADNCPDVYYTQQLGKDEKVDGGETNILSFKVMLTDSTTVYLIAHWGTSSCYGYKSDSEQYIKHGETVQIPINGISGTEEPDENESTEPTTPETTEPTEPTETVHTVAAGESLYQIAVQYQTTPELIAAYNEIADPGAIQVGQLIKIPPAGWVMPGNTTPPATEVTEPAETDTNAEN